MFAAYCETTTGGKLNKKHELILSPRLLFDIALHIFDIRGTRDFVKSNKYLAKGYKRFISI
jgi:hypothetical protein